MHQELCCAFVKGGLFVTNSDFHPGLFSHVAKWEENIASHGSKSVLGARAILDVSLDASLLSISSILFISVLQFGSSKIDRLAAPPLLLLGF
jgi:hypothetical protein